MPTRRKPSRTRWIVLLLLVALVGTGSYLWWRHSRREKPLAVQTAEVTRRSLIESVVATGRIHPVTKVVINPEVAGEIVELPVKEGQPVKAGDLLVKIRQDDYLANRNLAEAGYQVSLAQLKLNKANLDKAVADFERTRGLFESELISQAEFLAGKTAWQVAAASHEAAEHGVAQAKASRERAEEELGKTVIAAPIDGTVVQLRSEKGERVVGTSLMAGTEIMTVAQLDRMEARVEVGEVDVVLIETGQKVRIEADAFRDETFTGVVSEIANASNNAAMSGAASTMGGGNQEATKFQVKVRVTEKAAFRPGMSVTAYIETRSVEDVLTVPLQSVTTRAPAEPVPEDEEPPAEEGKGAARKKVEEIVFIAEGDRAVRRPVESGISDEEFIEIVSGLSEGETVVSGTYRAINRDLEDGSLIEVTEAPGRDEGE